MSDEKKREDFVELLKRMKSDMDTPSVIGDTLDKLEILKKENQELKDQLSIKNETLKTTEEKYRKILEETEKIKENSNRVIERLEKEITKFRTENFELVEKVKSIENTALKKNEDLIQKDKQIFELKTKMDSLSKQDITIQLNEKEKSISELKATIKGLDTRMKQLHEQNLALKKQLEEQKKSSVDYVIPVVEPTTTAKASEPTTPSFGMLDKLCQDLQSDLNRSKRTLDSIKAENVELKKALQDKGFAEEFKTIENLRKENILLKEELSKIEKSVEKDTLEVTLTVDSQDKIRELQQQLEEKQKIIEDLKEESLTQIQVPKGPMSGLIDELQAKINKMKILLTEKDQMISELSAKIKLK